MIRAFIGIGSNLGDRQAHIQLAEKQLALIPSTQLLKVSPVYETDPVGPMPQQPYLNAAAELGTSLPPLDLLDALRRIEQAAGRPPIEQRTRWGPRTLDLDILLFGEQVISSDRLVVPHPMLHERWFVLKPLADLDPGLVHPVLEMTIGDLLSYLKTDQGKVTGRGRRG